MTEKDALRFMNAWQARQGEFSGAYPDWVKAKVRALQVVEGALGRGLRSILDVGIGDMKHLVEWGGLDRTHYVGAEGAAEVVMARNQEHPRAMLHWIPASELVETRATQLMSSGGGGFPPEAVLLLDVVYHIPDHALAERLAAWVFEQGSRFVAISYALPTARPENPEGCWFPWPAPPVPPGWRCIFRAERGANQGDSHHQRLEVFERASA